MLISRRRLGATAAAAPALTALPAAASAAALPIILVGDWGRNGHDEQRAVAAQMGKTAAAMKPAFIISVGDNFYENGVTGTDDPQWQTSFEQIYTAPSLQVPWKIMLGNHDYRGSVQAQLDYAQTSRRWQIPARYYAERYSLPDGAVAEIVYLDTSPFIKKYLGSKVAVEGQDTQAQLDWLEAKLAASTADWKIVIGHHPIYAAHARDDGYEDPDTPELISRLNPLLLKYKIPLYVCGHDHVLQAVRMDGISYVCTGAGSQTYDPGPAIRGGFASGAQGFMTAEISRETLHWQFIDKDGNSLYAETITRA
jgi:acid phosphatase